MLQPARPCAQGRCGRCPPGSGVMSDLFFFVFVKEADPALYRVVNRDNVDSGQLFAAARHGRGTHERVTYIHTGRRLGDDVALNDSSRAALE